MPAHLFPFNKPRWTLTSSEKNLPSYFHSVRFSSVLAPAEGQTCCGKHSSCPEAGQSPQDWGYRKHSAETQCRNTKWLCKSQFVPYISCAKLELIKCYWTMLTLFCQCLYASCLHVSLSTYIFFITIKASQVHVVGSLEKQERPKQGFGFSPDEEEQHSTRNFWSWFSLFSHSHWSNFDSIHSESILLWCLWVQLLH